MPLSQEEMEEILEDDTLENEPVKMRGRGLTGRRRFVSIAEQRSRRETLSQLLFAGISRDQIFTIMGDAELPDGTPGFKMTRRAVTNLITHVYEKWVEDDDVDRPHKKAMAVRRIKRSIGKAASQNAWSSVAQMERTLSEIEGTKEPLKVEVGASDRLSEALSKVLQLQTEGQLRELIAEDKKYLAEHSGAVLSPSVITVPSES